MDDQKKRAEQELLERILKTLREAPYTDEEIASLEALTDWSEAQSGDD